MQLEVRIPTGLLSPCVRPRGHWYIPVILGILAGCGDVTAGDPGPQRVIPDEAVVAGEVLANTPEHAIVLPPDAAFLNLVLTPTVYEYLTLNFAETVDVATMTNWLSPTVADSFDFIMMALHEASPATTGPFGLHVRVAFEIDGLAIPEYQSFNFDPWRRLRSVIVFRSHESLERGPSLHEILHRWGQVVIGTIDLPHWGLAGIGGQLGGWVTGTLERDGDEYTGRGPAGIWSPIANGGNRVPYAPLELYLMGLLPIDSVPPFEIAVDGVMADFLSERFVASRIDTVEAISIVQNHGPRAPAWPDAPSRFRALYVLISDAPLTDAYAREVSFDIEQFTRHQPNDSEEFLNFFEATGGRGSMDIGALQATIRR